MSNATFEITVDYKSPNSTEILNRFNYPAITPGIYIGGELSSPATDILRIAEFTAYIKSTTNDVLVKIVSTGNQDVSITSSKPYAVMTYTWLNQQNNTPSFTAKSLGEIVSTDIVFGMAEYSGATIIDFIYENTTYGSLKSTDIASELDHLHYPTNKAVNDYILNVLYPVGTVVAQFPSAASNTESVAFPVADRPATKFGGTWTEIFTSDDAFFKVGTTDHQTRTDGLSPDQMQKITGSFMVYAGILNGGTQTGAFSISNEVSTRPANGANAGYANLSFNSASSPDARTSATTAGVTEPRNYRMKIWKRTA